MRGWGGKKREKDAQRKGARNCGNSVVLPKSSLHISLPPASQSAIKTDVGKLCKTTLAMLPSFTQIEVSETGATAEEIRAKIHLGTILENPITSSNKQSSPLFLGDDNSIWSFPSVCFFSQRLQHLEVLKAVLALLAS